MRHSDLLPKKVAHLTTAKIKVYWDYRRYSIFYREGETTFLRFVLWNFSVNYATSNLTGMYYSQRKQSAYQSAQISSPSGIASSNPAECMDVRVLCFLRVV